jgi:hypothetical protein
VDDVDAVEIVERVEVLGGNGFLESFFGILRLARGRLIERGVNVVMEGFGVEKLGLFLLSPRGGGDVTSLTCAL